MTRSAVLIGDLCDEEGLRLYYCNGCNPIDAEDRVLDWIREAISGNGGGSPVDRIEQKLLAEDMYLRASGKEAYNWTLGDTLVWIDNFVFISTKEGKVQYFRSMVGSEDL